MSLNVMTAVWGDHHIDMWRKAALQSLSFKDNRAALYENDAILNIFTDKRFFEFVTKMVDVFLPEMKVRVVCKTDLRGYIDPVQAAAILMMEMCLKDNSKLLMAPPDTIFGNGAIKGLLEAGKDKHSCVVVPHPRVLPSILHTPLMPYSNQELVDVAWKHLHKSWTDAEVGHPVRNSFVGGVSWWRDGLEIKVIHRLPTVYLADFTPTDLDYFKAQISFGGWDHTWPGEVLIHHNRQRFVDNSDVAFIVEITDKDKNVPPIWDGPVDGFWQNHAHNIENAKVISTFRGVNG